MRGFLVLCVLLVNLWPLRAQAASTPPVLDLGGFIVDGPFLAFIQAQGGPGVFGAALSDALIDPHSGLRVQYFRYARLELHGSTVLLSRLGSLYAAGREQEAPFAWQTAESIQTGDRIYFAESGHSLGGAFRHYHQHQGAVPLLGYPISEEFVEHGPDGEAVLVQYFERAVLIDRDGAVERAGLGNWLAERELSAAQRSPGPPLRLLASERIRYRAGSNDGHNIELAASKLHGRLIEAGAQLSFLQAIGPISAEAGFRPGTAIVGGEVVESAIGGGVCTIATLLYRAAWSAGLPIIEQRAHRYQLQAYRDRPGLDAAVYQPTLDLRIADNSGARIYLELTAAGGIATIKLWGRGDGRVVTLSPPEQRADGLEVRNARRITAADGRVQREVAITRYEPMP